MISNTKPWWQGSFGYQIYIRSFADSNNDGFGDFQGIRSKIAYLKDLGLFGLHLSTLHLWSTVGTTLPNIVISIRHYTLDDFDALVEQAHANDIKIVADLVPNHTSDQHEWFKEARRVQKTNFATTTFGKTSADGGPQTTGLHTSADQHGPSTKIQASTTCTSSFLNN